MKSRGKMLTDALIVAVNKLGATGVSFAEAAERLHELAAAEYDHARAELPADVEAFVQEVEARANKATPGPWFDARYFDDGAGPHIEDDAQRKIAIVQLDCTEHSDNARFIESARADIPRLIAIVREQGAQNAALRALVCSVESNENWRAEVLGLRDRLAKLEAFKERLDALKDESEKSAERCDNNGAHETATNHYGHVSAYMRARQEFVEILNEKGGV